MSLHDALGVLGGMGYAALIALIAHRLGARRGPISLAVSAAGQRSLTCYLAQSVVWTLVSRPIFWTYPAHSPTTALLAGCTWLLTALMADQMRRVDYRGPFEILIRRFTYRTHKSSGAISTM